MKKLLLNRKGVIALITMIVLAGVGMLGIAMVVTSQLNSVASNNYRYKIQTFNAADGMMTLLAQDILDFNESNYLTGRPHMDIGNPPVSGGYGYNSLARTDTLRGSGSLHVGVKDSCHFSYCEMKGNMELSIKFVTHKPGARGKAGIMVRQDLTAGAKYVLLAYVDKTTDTIRLQSRKAVGASSALRANASGVTLPMYLKLNKIDSIFYASYSTTGVTWTDLGKDTVRLIDPVYVGLAIGSGTTARDTAIFTNSAGIPIDTRLDTVKIGVDSVPVIYRLNKMGADIFTMETEGYKTIDGSPAHNYETRLNQTLAREDTGGWYSPVRCSAYIPVTLYDFRADGTNPEFNVNMSILPKTAGGYVSEVAHFVQDTLDQDRKPILKIGTQPKKLRDSLLCDTRWGKRWYDTTAAFRIKMDTAVTFVEDSMAWARCNKIYDWNFCDSLYKWFRPSNAIGADFDPLTGKWTNLVNRPKYRTTAPEGWYLTVPNEWVGSAYDSTNKFANIVFYDSLLFRQKTCSDTGLYYFDSANAWTKRDSMYYVKGCNVKKGFNPWWAVWKSPVVLDTAFFASTECKFMPLRGKGFKYDAVWHIPKGFNACVDSQNFGFTMEIHKKFTYRKNQIFKFRGDDDVFVYINNKLRLDLGGIHLAKEQTIQLDTCGLVEPNEYWFDMFYCERCVAASNIYITTNMMFWIPPQPLKRSWKRDYGNLD